MNIDDLTIGQAKQITKLFDMPIYTSEPIHEDHPYIIGATYLIRTVTMTNVGVLVKVTNNELVLKDAAWIPNTGRFADALKSGNYDEVEPFPDGEVIIGRGSVIDAVIVKNSRLSQK